MSVFANIALELAARTGEKCLVNEINRGCCSLNVQKNNADLRFVEGRHALLRRRLLGNVLHSHANGLVVPIHAAARVMRRPAGFILEQTNRSNAPVPAQIEPVKRASWNPNQVPRFYLDCDDRTLLRVDMEEPSPGEDRKSTRL